MLDSIYKADQMDSLESLHECFTYFSIGEIDHTVLKDLNLCNKISTRKIYNIGKSMKFYSMRKVNLVAALKLVS